MKTMPVMALSWKNVWRNPLRSSVVIISVVLGVWAALFTAAFMNGMIIQYMDVQLANITSHIQIHTDDYEEERIPVAVIPNANDVLNTVRGEVGVKHAVGRAVVDGLISTSAGSFGVTAKGIDFENEPNVTNLHKHIREGEYLSDEGRNSILIGSKLAKRLQVQMNSRVVLNVQDVDGMLTAGAFRVSGIFHSPDARVNENMVFLRQNDLANLILKPDAIHEIAIIIDDYKQADHYASRLDSILGMSVKSWGDISPALRYTDSVTDITLYIFMIIIVIALMFGIVNTMLMAVLERTPELGMLMAVGLSRGKAFQMIMYETIMLTMVGAPFGIALSALTVYYTGINGIDLSAFAQGFEMYGLSYLIYPVLNVEQYISNALIIALAALAAAVLPSWKALRLNPVEAIRKR
jgi:ABC-type lipoprotein release transport system permease subunit